MTRVTQAIRSSLASLFTRSMFPIALSSPPPGDPRPYAPPPPTPNPSVAALAKSVCFSPGCFNYYPMTMLAGLVTEHSLDHERGSAPPFPDLAGKGHPAIYSLPLAPDPQSEGDQGEHTCFKGNTAAVNRCNCLKNFLFVFCSS